MYVPPLLFGKADKQWNATGTTLTTSDDEGVIRIYKRKSAARTVFHELIISNICQIMEIVWKDDGRRARRDEWALGIRPVELYSMHIWYTLSLGSRALRDSRLMKKRAITMLTVELTVV
jgi:hypothetical protein